MTEPLVKKLYYSLILLLYRPRLLGEGLSTSLSLSLSLSFSLYHSFHSCISHLDLLLTMLNYSLCFSPVLSSLILSPSHRWWIITTPSYSKTCCCHIIMYGKYHSYHSLLVFLLSISSSCCPSLTTELSLSLSLYQPNQTKADGRHPTHPSLVPPEVSSF